MPTLILQSAKTVTTAHRQTPEEALDLDGYNDFALYLKVDNFNAGGSSLVVEVVHAARNVNDDYLNLWTSSDIIVATSTILYFSDFARFLRTKIFWKTAGATTKADVELLVLPKR
jgi:hypothetical protein